PPPFLVPRSLESIEIDQKLQEIMKQTGYLTVGGQVRMRGYLSMGGTGEDEGGQTDVFIAMELMGTCAEKLKKRIQGPIPERILGKMTVAIVKALLYLKEKHGVIHRDVKPSNILLDERGQIKLCDFGISGRLVDSKAKTRSAGCAAYMAQMRRSGNREENKRILMDLDVVLKSHDCPYIVQCFGTKTDFEVLTKVLQEDPPLLPPAMGFSGDFQAFVRDCLTKDHRKRPKYNKLLEHTFIKRYETLEVDVATWFKDVMARTESPRPGGGLGHHLPFFTR
ncbi:dual specificity mitogen-activated protein kinase kinase 7, partial [Geospiza fortis]|uniref:mitogen-activated protein kinase kinase n=1 Tax=Geospiza fortis TaxID=48883 RepID=A0A8N5F5R7_GEOFO